jgi:hypothetical protein
MVQRTRLQIRKIHPHQKRATLRNLAGSGTASGTFSAELKAGIDRPSVVWFEEPVRELSFRATNLNVVYTLLHFKNSERTIWNAESTIENSHDRFQRT